MTVRDSWRRSLVSAPALIPSFESVCDQRNFVGRVRYEMYQMSHSSVRRPSVGEEPPTSPPLRVFSDLNRLARSHQTAGTTGSRQWFGLGLSQIWCFWSVTRPVDGAGSEQ